MENKTKSHNDQKRVATPDEMERVAVVVFDGSEERFWQGIHDARMMKCTDVVFIATWGNEEAFQKLRSKYNF